MKKIRNVSVKRMEAKQSAGSKDEDKRMTLMTTTIESIQPITTVHTHNQSDIPYYHPTEIEKNIMYVNQLKDSQSQPFEYPIKIYSDKPAKTCKKLEYTSFYGVKSLDELNPYSKLAYEMIFSDKKFNGFINNFKQYQGKYDTLPRFQQMSGITATSTFIDKTENQKDGSTTTKKTQEDEVTKVVRGIAKKGILEMYPPVENITILSSKKLRPRFLSLYQEHPDSYYILEIKNNEDSKSVRRWVDLEFCSQIKYGMVNNKKTLELYVNELIYVFTTSKFDDLTAWMTTLCTATGLEMDIQTGATSKSNYKYGNKSSSDADIWKTADLPQLSEYSSDKDRQLIRKMGANCEKLFNVYQNLFKSVPNITHSSKKALSKTYVTLEINSISFGLKLDNNDSDKPIEPYVVNCFLFDAYENKKITGDIYFDIQNEALVNLNIPVVQHNIKDVVRLTNIDYTNQKIHNGVFEINDGLNQEIYLIAKVMKLYDGGQYYDAYLKPDNKLAKKQCDYASIISKSGLMYMTYFACGYKKLFDSHNKILNEKEELTLYKFDYKYFDMAKFIKEITSTDSKSKIVSYPGGKIMTTMRIIESIEKIPNCLTSSFELYSNPKNTSNPQTVNNNTKYTYLASSLVDTRKVEYPPFENITNNLYIYPIEVNMTNCKSQVSIKNVIIEFHIKGDSQRSFFPLFYSRYGNICMTETDSCTIVPKSLHPNFSEEFRVMIPNNITDDYHLLIAYYSIDTKRLFKENKSKKLPKCLLGYSWVKLLSSSGEFDLVREVSLPAVSTLPDNYIKYDLENVNTIAEYSNELRWLDGQGRPVVKLEMHYRSNVLCFDETFIKLVNLSKKSPSISENVESYSKLIKVCHVITELAITTGYNVIFQWLINLLIASNELTLKSQAEKDLIKSTVSLITHILNRLVANDYGKVLSKFVNCHLIVYNKAGGYVHDNLLRGLYDMIHIDPKKLDSTFQNSWFFTKILTKSFKTLISTSYKYKAGNRSGLISKKCEELLQWFIHSMIRYVINKVGRKSVRVVKVNNHLAKFVGELLNILDRNFVISMISYLYETYKYFDSKVEFLSDLRFDFLRILCKHEFFLPINVPPLVLNKQSNNNGVNFYLSPKFCNNHYLVAIVIEEVQKSLTQSLDCRTEAILLFRDLLVKHHFDDRYAGNGNNSGSCIGIVMSLYMPFITVIVENTHLFLPSTHNHSNEERNEESISYTIPNTPMQRSIATMSSISKYDFSSMRLNTCDSVTGPLTNSPYESHSSFGELADRSLLYHHTRDILICFMYILQNVSRDTLINFWNLLPKLNLKMLPSPVQANLRHILGEKSSNKQIYFVQFFLILQSAIEVFKLDKNVSFKKDIVLESLSNTTLKDGNASLASKSKLKRALRGDSTFACTDNALFQEITVLILDIIDMFCSSQKIMIKMDGGNNSVVKVILETYLHILSNIHSKQTMKYYLAHLRLFIQGKYFIIFKGQNNFLEKLFVKLFEKLPYLDSDIRKEISYFIYLVLKSNFYFTNNCFQRSYIKLICASTQIMDNNLVAKFVLRCVSNWTRYLKDDIGAKGNEFSNEIIDLNRRIHSILKVGQRMNKHINDIETSIDILYNLSNTFSETPEILISWFDKMAETHEKNGYYSEAAMCSLHSAVVYVQLLKSADSRIMKDDVELYRSISSNIRLFNFSAKKEEIGDVDSITIDHFYTHLIKTSDYFVKAQRYEAVAPLFKCIISVLETNKSYAELGTIYKNMSLAYENIADKSVCAKRNFGAYFRVAFYGKGFRENGGKNFIYKEPPYTPLAAIKERLETIYTNSVGNVRIILEGGTVKTDSLDPNINYIQINSVIPLEEYKNDGNSDLTNFDMNTNIRAFVLEVPFTQSGKAHGGIEEQWKRVTTFHTHHAFPYMKKRLNVTHKIVQELTPIKVAIDEMSQQVKQLQSVVNMSPPDMKRLQLKLQGSVSVTVNAGPVSYANTFASKNAEPIYPKADIITLRNIFREFLVLCSTALQINSDLVQSDQILYHKDMCEKFENLKKTINDIIGEVTIA